MPRIPHLQGALAILFCIALGLGVTGNVAYIYMAAKLNQTGFGIRPFSGLRALKAPRYYKEAAAVRGWSFWPFVTFWLAVAGISVIAITFGVLLRTR